ncbi:MAG: hypothetical protein ACOX1R_02880 [Caldicoprobacterales bacterium]
MKEDGYLVLFWYNSRGLTEEAKVIDQRVNRIIGKYANRQSSDNKPERAAHSGVFKKEDRKAEIEDSGLFKILNIFQYRTEVMNNSEQYLKAQKSVPAFASILDGMEESAIRDMEEEIVYEIDNNGGYVGTIFDYSLYIAKKINKNTD